ncbi:MAG TPA: hypothetical protein PLP47_01205 [Methanofastidiosum sp.]|nr:hypothetical protein [Methanofastidiosum sp.]
MSKSIIAVLGILVLLLGAISYLMYMENKDLKEDIEMLNIEKTTITGERDDLKSDIQIMIPVNEKNALKLVNAYIWDNGQKIAGTRSFSFHPYSPTYKIKDNGNIYEIEVLRGIGKIESDTLTVSYHALMFEVNKNTGEVIFKGIGEATFPDTVYTRTS